MKARSDAARANDIITKETAMNAAVLTADLRPFNNAVNLEGNPVKRVGQNNLVDMYKYDQRQGLNVSDK